MSDRNFPQAIIKLIDSLSANENYDTLIQILALLCVFSIANRPSSNQPTLVNAAPESPLQKLIGDFSKGASPDMLSTLLPLLGNSQVKSKLNPANLTSIISMINNLAGGFKQPPAKPTESTASAIPPAANNTSPQPSVQTTVQTAKPPETCAPVPAAALPPSDKQAAPVVPMVPTTATTSALPAAEDSQPAVAKPPNNRHLNWKTNF